MSPARPRLPPLSLNDGALLRGRDSSAGLQPMPAPRTDAAVGSFQHENKVLLVLTLIIGAVVGLVVVAFILLTENLGSRLYPAGGAAWRRVLIPVAGSLSTGYLLFRYFPHARGSGIPQTKTALFLRDGYISLRTVLGKFGLCSVSLASGIALGREGPSVQVGAGIASVLGRRLGLSAASVKALVPVGASAALAAAFNTPIAAVLFALEEVMGDMHAPVLGSIVLGSATSWIVLHLVLGDEPLFHVPAYQLVHPLEFACYAVLGLAGGVVSAAFVKLLLWQRKRFLTLPRSTGWLYPAVGGLTVGLLGWFVPDVLGVGYGVVGKALNGQLAIAAMALLVGLKIVATATCYASGNAGGIFGPSLFMGAMMGGAVGGVAHLLLPDYTGSVGAYALVGMGAAFAGIVRVPLTSVIMIFEMTRDYSIIVPLMIANLISYYISSRLQHEPIYEALQHQDGIHLPSGARARESFLMVGHAYRPAAQVLSATETVSQAAASADRDRGAWPVVDQHGLRGMIAATQLDEAVQAGRGGETLGGLVPDPGPIEHLAAVNFPHLHADHPLDAAMHRLAQSGLPVLPVVSRTNVRDVQGTISLPDVLAAYRIGQAHEPQAHEQPSAAGMADPPATRRLLVRLVAAVAGVAFLAASLNYYYRAERVGRAQRYYQAGEELLAAGRYDEAIAQYRQALSITHTSERRQALALALLKAGRLDEASIYLREALRDSPASGPVNLGLARVAAQEGRIDDALAHYQRAIYGSWVRNAQQNRVQTRIELVGVLGRAGKLPQAQAELLSLAAELPGDPAMGKQVARMMIDFGLPRQAATLFRHLLDHNRQDAGAWDGLGEAEFAMGDDQAARQAFRAALQIEPADRAAASRMDLCDRTLVLDPALKGLPAKERFGRSREILSKLLDEALRCAGGEDALPTPLKDAVERARASLAAKRRPPSFSDAVEANTAIAEQLWSVGVKSCAANPPPDEALKRVMTRLARP